MRTRPRSWALAASLALAVTTTVAGCSGGSSTAGGTPSAAAGTAGGSAAAPAIVVGTTLSLTGSLSALGAPAKAGYQQEIAHVNAAGGVVVGGRRERVRLVVLNNASDPETASAQTAELVGRDHAVALLGPATGPIVLPAATAAEQLHVPFLTSLMPAGAFSSGDKDGWNYAWDLSGDQQQQAAAAARALAAAPGDKKVALFTDDEPDSVTGRPLYLAAFRAAGLQVVGDYTVAAGTTSFGADLAAARAKGAQLLAGQLTPASGVALWKQLKSSGLTPAAAFLADAANAGSWWQSLGGLAQGTLAVGYWSPGQASAGQLAAISSTLGKRYAGTPGYAPAALSYAVAQVLTNALAAAGSTSPARLNAAIGRTDAPTTAGRIRFSGATHTAVTPSSVARWQDGRLLPLPSAA